MYHLKNKQGLALSQIAQIISAELIGDAATMILGICAVDQPIPGNIAFLHSGKLGSELKVENLRCLGALVVPRGTKDLTPLSGMNLLVVDEPLTSIFKIVPYLYYKSNPHAGVHEMACVDPSAVLGANVVVGAFACIGSDCVVGDGSVLYPHSVLYPGAQLGKAVVVHAGAVIREGVKLGDGTVIQNGAVVGADGFGYIPTPSGLEPIPHIGSLELGKNVEVGANTCIDRATFGSATIGNGSKIDNLVQVGHNATIGENVILCGCTGIAGSCTIESGVVIGGGVGIADHVTIKSGIRVSGASVVSKSLTMPGDYGGHFARPIAEWRRQQVALRKLPDLLAKIKNLEQE